MTGTNLNTGQSNPRARSVNLQWPLFIVDVALAGHQHAEDAPLSTVEATFGSIRQVRRNATKIKSFVCANVHMPPSLRSVNQRFADACVDLERECNVSLTDTLRYDVQIIDLDDSSACRLIGTPAIPEDSRIVFTNRIGGPHCRSWSMMATAFVKVGSLGEPCEHDLERFQLISVPAFEVLHHAVYHPAEYEAFRQRTLPLEDAIARLRGVLHRRDVPSERTDTCNLEALAARYTAQLTAYEMRRRDAGFQPCFKLISRTCLFRRLMWAPIVQGARSVARPQLASDAGRVAAAAHVAHVQQRRTLGPVTVTRPPTCVVPTHRARTVRTYLLCTSSL